MAKDSLAELAHPEYWDKRYAEKEGEETYNWLMKFELVWPFLKKHLPPPVGVDAKEKQEDNGDPGGPKILHLGCGNSVCRTSCVHDDTPPNII
jgi:hypothetical protein